MITKFGHYYGHIRYNNPLAAMNNNEQQSPPRVCAICHKPGGFPCALVLEYYSIVGTHAHEDCIIKLKIETRKKSRERYQL